MTVSKDIYIRRMTQWVLTSLIPGEDDDADSTPVIQGVCAWLQDMGILDGNDDEVIERLERMAEDGDVRKGVNP